MARYDRLAGVLSHIVTNSQGRQANRCRPGHRSEVTPERAGAQTAPASGHPGPPQRARRPPAVSRQDRAGRQDPGGRIHCRDPMFW
ncbi:hypothetical protein GGTG_10670 [Gaeumannomyces tritici R3-111a-1]|uniref:Uncharacterized protein n=1 Tax=Gaeumannomyces tritici (strain R3-111a-1) TaxID=644352 RepID=J3PAZ6_GAET3|nr:hypothetical protein GGTG_10670 [Gaeumannomyces tritici R3-111a-1]EJT71412.1 hypothetical protein GGTG_10670 [Gaeumannomyces tritici R3-111a-1]